MTGISSSAAERFGDRKAKKLATSDEGAVSEADWGRDNVPCEFLQALWQGFSPSGIGKCRCQLPRQREPKSTNPCPSHQKAPKEHESLPFSSEESRGLMLIGVLLEKTADLHYFRFAYRDNSFI